MIVLLGCSQATLVTEETRHHPEQVPGVPVPGQLPYRVHGKCRHPEIQGADAGFSGRNRPDCTSTGHVSAHDEGVYGHILFRGEQPVESRGLAVRGIALVGVDLDDRPGVLQGAMVVVMAIGKVRMNAVRIVGREQHGPLHQGIDIPT